LAPLDARFAGLGDRFAAPDAGFAAPDARLVPPDAGFAAPDAGFAAPDARFVVPEDPAGALRLEPPGGRCFEPPDDPEEPLPEPLREDPSEPPEPPAERGVAGLFDPPDPLLYSLSAPGVALICAHFRRPNAQAMETLTP
jgi:hypothetical protein